MSCVEEVFSGSSPQVASLLGTQSPEVASKVAASGDEAHENRAKVVEEAVAGWEKVENGVVVLKQPIEAEFTGSKLIKRGISLLSGTTFFTAHFIPDSLQPFPHACINPCIHLSTNCSIN